MNINEALAKIAEVQATIAITEPVALQVKRAYWPPPPQSKVIPKGDIPCFLNTWTAPVLRFGAGVIRGDLTVRMQLLISDSEQDQARLIASSFYQAIVTAFAGNMKLGDYQPAHVKTIRGGEPTLVALEYGGVWYTGLDLYLETGITFSEAMGA